MMSQTITLVNPDYRIVKTELYDTNVMDCLLRDTASFSKKDLTKLSLYKRSRKHGNSVEVVYHFGKGCDKDRLGRLYAKNDQGLQSFPFDMRNPLLEKHYWDIDMANCHYRLLARLADSWGLKTDGIQQYIQNRDEEMLKVSSDRLIAKTTFLKIAYGGNIKLYNEHYNDIGAVDACDLTLVKRIEKEMSSIVDLCWSKYDDYHKIVKNRPNPKFSLFALILQTEERKCLEAIDEFMRLHDRSVDILIHDGCEVRKLPNEMCFPEELLRGAEKHVKEATGYDIVLVNKPIKHNFLSPDCPSFTEVPPTVVVDDSFAAREFVKCMGEHIVLDSGVVWVYDRGLWSNDEAILQRVITNCDAVLRFSQGDKFYNYSGSVKNTKNLMVKLPDVLPSKDGWFQSRVHSDIGKLLFPNGIYDFKTGEFKEEFDSKIIFTGRMPRNFPTKNQALVDEIRRISFIEAFGDEDNRDTMLHSLMRAFIGDTLRKKFIIGTGFRNSGKGMIATLLHSAMGMLCSDYNGNCLLYKSFTGESAKDYGWLKANVKTRISIGSEIAVKDKDKSATIDGVLIKTLSSGVDAIKMRGLYERETSIVNKSTFFMFAQDLPSISPPDESIQGRIIASQWSYSYVDEPVHPFQRKADYTLAPRYATAEYGDAFFWLMVEEYEKWRGNDFVEPRLTEMMLLNREEFAPTVDVLQLLKDHNYEITRSAEDWVDFNVLYPLFEGSKTSVGRLLGGFGLEKKYKKVDGKTITVYFGIRYISS